MNTQLITITTNEQGSLVVSSLDFAPGLDIQHKNLLETIRTHQEVIEREFGPIAFETRKTEQIDSALETRNLDEKKKSTKPITIAYLTEDQALFIGTLSRNSKRVVEFKATLVKSFAEAKKLLLAPAVAPSPTEQVLLQLVSQTNQIMATQSEVLAQLRIDVDRIKNGRSSRLGRQLALPGLPQAVKGGVSSFRQYIHRRVIEYCGYHGVTAQQTYTYLYKRMFEVYSVNVYRLTQAPNESLLDTLERYGHLDRLYSLVMAELAYSEE